MVDIDATNLALTLTTIGGDVRVTFVGYGDGSGGDRVISIGVDVDGTPYTLVKEQETGDVNYSFSYIFTGLLAGSHTFKMQWQTSAGTATLYAGTLLFDVREEIGVVA